MRRVPIHIIVSLLLLFFASDAFPFECINGTFLFHIKTTANQPSDISIGLNGDLYLVDGVNNRIMVFDGNGTMKFSFGTQGTGEGELRYPLGIDISDQGEVFIADSGNHRIQVFDSKGNFLRMFAVQARSGEKPSDPVDVIASSLKDYVYVSDNDNHKIKVYDKNGSFQFEWGKFGEGPGEFRYPGIMAQSQNNEIFVVDVLNTRVQKFDPFGNYITEIGSWGVLPGQLFRPKGIAIDRENRVFVSDSYMGLIQVFSDFGQFLGVLCEQNEKREFVTPVGLFIDGEKHVLGVVEMKRNRISLLKISGL